MCGGVHNIEMHLITISLLRGMCFAGNHTLKLTSPLPNDSSRLKVCGSSREEGRLYRRGEKKGGYIEEERRGGGKKEKKREKRKGKERVCSDGRRERTMAANNTSGLLRALQMAVASCSIMASLNSSEPRSRLASAQHCVQDVNIMYTQQRVLLP